MKRSEEDFELLSYDYFLPKELIATHPIYPKEEANLLVYERAKDKITHAKFGDLPNFLPKNCAIVFNDTKVIKARIYGTKQSGGKVELFLHRPLNENEFLAQIKGKVKVGEILDFEANLKAEILELLNDGIRRVKFFQNGTLLDTHSLFILLETIGHVPLPPYIKRADEKADEKDYQSIFAKNLGAVAAPTASLHFSENLLEILKAKHQIYSLTLHVGAGTFKGVECENIKDHAMHAEYFNMSKEIASLIKTNAQILGVGTTSTRCIEYYARTGLKQGFCDLFLHPFNPPLRQDFLLTNFHLPKSTLIMLVSSFIGRTRTLELYHEAIKEKYRFYSYGDAMLIL